jgi:hypothetical protein
MLRKSLLGRVATAIAGLGLLLPAGVNAAEAPVTAAVRQVGTDVTLQNGHFHGQFVNAQGGAVAGATVVVRQRGVEVARTVTNEQGQFAAALQPGLYEVTVGSQTDTVRVWDAQVAPPAARGSALFVAGDQSRGQCGCNCFDYTAMAAIGIGTAALVVGIIALDQADNNQSN